MPPLYSWSVCPRAVGGTDKQPRGGRRSSAPVAALAVCRPPPPRLPPEIGAPARLPAPSAPRALSSRNRQRPRHEHRRIPKSRVVWVDTCVGCGRLSRLDRPPPCGGPASRGRSHAAARGTRLDLVWLEGRPARGRRWQENHRIAQLTRAGLAGLGPAWRRRVGNPHRLRPSPPSWATGPQTVGVPVSSPLDYFPSTPHRRCD